MPRIKFLKIIDESLLPAVIVISAKVFGLLLANFYLGNSFTLSLNSLSLTGYLPENYGETQFLNSVSDGMMLLAIVIGFSWVLIKAHHFHESHIHPVLATRLSKKGWGHLISDSYEIYHQSLVWSSLLWFNLFLILLRFSLGLIFFWVLAATLLAVVTLTYLLWEDVRRELSFSK